MNGPWGWKDPRTALALEFWRGLFPGLRLVLCVRNPVEIALDSRTGETIPPLEQALAAWEGYHRPLDALAPGAYQVAHYRSVLYDPAGETDRLIATLGLSPATDALKAAAGIASGHWYRIPVTDESMEEFHLPEAVRARYDVLCSRAGEIHAKMVGDERHQTRLRRRGLVSMVNDLLEERRQRAVLLAQHTGLLAQHDACMSQSRLLRNRYPRRRQLVEQRFASLWRQLGGLRRRCAVPADAASPGCPGRLWALRRQGDLTNLFSELWYLKLNPDVGESGVDPLSHFLTLGLAEGRSPNPYIDRSWYVAQYPEVAAAGIDPLVDYLSVGWRRGRSPGPRFDVVWYLRQNPDVARAGVEPLGHYLQFGWRENRNPSPSYSVEEHLQGRPEITKLGIEPYTYACLYPQDPGGSAHGEGMILAGVIEEEIRASFSSPEESPDHEREEIIDLGDPPVKLIAFYLPQFHPVPENDAHWGRGFTEWMNVSRARPMFRGHYQPHLPGELGFYDLRIDDVMLRQVELGRQHGVHGFCFYRYWFNGRTVLDLPLERFLARPEIEMNYCICWANENWTRRWDGREEEVLLSQVHSVEDDEAFIADALRFFRDPRYIKVDGRPLLIVYQTQKMPEPARTAARWRAYCARNGFRGLYLVAAQTCGFLDPTPIGFDAAVQFPPHNRGIENLAPLLDTYGPFFGQIHEYSALAEINTVQSKEYTLFNTVCVGWDNTARRGPAARIFQHSTPRGYERWLTDAIGLALKAHPPDRRYVFINAWNEWAEGTHLEPDRKFGYAYLNATSRVLRASRAGAQGGR